MKKWLLVSSLIISFISPAAFAANTCIENINTLYHDDGNWLDLGWCNLSASDMSDVIAFMKKNAVNELNLSGNEGIGSLAMQLLAKNSLTPEYLLMNGTDLNDEDMGSLPESVISLYMDHNAITDKGIAYLTSHSKNLQELSMDSNPVTANGISMLVNTQPQLDWLSLQDDNLDDSAAEILSHKHFDTLVLSNNLITDQGAAAIAKTNVRQLVLDGNHITTEGGKALSSDTELELLSLNYNDAIGHEAVLALAKLPGLESLSLCFDKLINDSDLKVIANSNIEDLRVSFDPEITAKGVEALSHAASLQTVFLQNENLGDDAAESLAKNKNLTAIILDENNITAKGVAALMNSRKEFEVVALCSNPIGDDGAALFANHTFNQFLFLIYSDIGDQGAIAMSQNLHTALLDVSGNHIGEMGLASLRANPDIQMLRVDDQDNKRFKIRTSFLLNDKMIRSHRRHLHQATKTGINKSVANLFAITL